MNTMQKSAAYRDASGLHSIELYACSLCPSSSSHLNSFDHRVGYNTDAEQLSRFVQHYWPCGLSKYPEWSLIRETAHAATNQKTSVHSKLVYGHTTTDHIRAHQTLRLFSCGHLALNPIGSGPVVEPMCILTQRRRFPGHKDLISRTFWNQTDFRELSRSFNRM